MVEVLDMVDMVQMVDMVDRVNMVDTLDKADILYIVEMVNFVNMLGMVDMVDMVGMGAGCPLSPTRFSPLIFVPNEICLCPCWMTTLFCMSTPPFRLFFPLFLCVQSKQGLAWSAVP
jgi:hypothetical protein